MAAATIGLLSQPAAAQEKVWQPRPDQRQGRRRHLHDGRRRATLPPSRASSSNFCSSRTTSSRLKALIAGEVDSFEGGPQGVFAADCARAPTSKSSAVIGWWCRTASTHATTSHKVEDLKGKSIAVSAPNSMPDMLARSALAKYGVTDNDVKLAAVGGDRERYQALVGGVVEGRGGVERISADRAEEHPSAGRRPRRGAEFPARLHGHQRQDAGRARRRRGQVPGRRNERAALRAVAQGRDGRADPRATIPSVARSFTMRWMFWRLAPMSRASQATGCGRSAATMLPSTCQRALVRPSSATSRSPDATRRLVSRNRSRMRPVNAVPAGVRSVVIICLHIFLLTS